MSDLSRWVNDELHGLLGYAESSVAQFLVAQASKAKSASQLHAAMVSMDIQPSAQSQVRVGHVSSRAIHQRRQQQRQQRRQW